MPHGGALWFEPDSKIEIDTIKNKYINYELRERFYKQYEEFQQLTARERVPLSGAP